MAPPNARGPQDPLLYVPVTDAHSLVTDLSLADQDVEAHQAPLGALELDEEEDEDEDAHVQATDDGVDVFFLNRRLPAWRRAALAALLLGALALAAGALLTAPPQNRRSRSRKDFGEAVVGLNQKQGADLQKSVGTIKGSFSLVSLAGDGGGNITSKCHMSDKEECPVADMPRDKLVGVFPGGETTCVSKSPYMFQVIRGDSDKLLIHFQGGGACWDEWSFQLGLCTKSVGAISSGGIFNRTNSANPFCRYTIVVVSYCSGDAHVGDVERNWAPTDDLPKYHDPLPPVLQRGYKNAKAAIDWAKENVGGSKLEAFMITGSSAGSLGAQVWGRTLLSTFSYEAASLVADSYAGIFPAGTQGGMQQATGLCTTGLLKGPMLTRCKTGTCDVQGIYLDTMSRFPDVAFGSIDAKADKVQMAFYDMVDVSLNNVDGFVLPEQFSQKQAAIYRQYNAQPNWVSYKVNNVQHQFLISQVMYETTPLGTGSDAESEVGSTLLAFTTGNRLQGKKTSLLDWLSRFPVRPGHSVHSVCMGVAPVATTAESASSAWTSGKSLSSVLSAGLGQVGVAMGAALGPAAKRAAQLTGLEYCEPEEDHKVFTA